MFVPCFCLVGGGGRGAGGRRISAEERGASVWGGRGQWKEEAVTPPCTESGKSAKRCVSGGGERASRWRRELVTARMHLGWRGPLELVVSREPASKEHIPLLGWNSVPQLSKPNSMPFGRTRDIPQSKHTVSPSIEMH